MRARAKRVLHVVGAMNRGGVETWLMHLLRSADRDRLAMDFLVHSDAEAAFDEEIRSLGAHIHRAGHPRQLASYCRAFLRILREHGPYDVVHSHVHHFSGLTLALAKRGGVPERFAHSHSDPRARESQRGRLRSAYLSGMQHLIRRNATRGLACAASAAEALYGDDWRRDERWSVAFCGIDLGPFQVGGADPALRAQLGIPPAARVVGHVGSFTYPKNHALLLEIARAVVDERPDTMFLLVGDGPLRAETEQRAAALGLERHIVFAGLRADVPRLMLGAMDVFLMPSRYEGLPMVVIEAQAADLPCVLSDAVTTEVDVIAERIGRVSLQAPRAEWAAAVLSALDQLASRDPGASVARLRNSPFDIDASLAALSGLYDGGRPAPRSAELRRAGRA